MSAINRRCACRVWTPLTPDEPATIKALLNQYFISSKGVFPGTYAAIDIGEHPQRLIGARMTRRPLDERTGVRRASHGLFNPANSSRARHHKASTAMFADRFVKSVSARCKRPICTASPPSITRCTACWIAVAAWGQFDSHMPPRSGGQRAASLSAVARRASDN